MLKYIYLFTIAVLLSTSVAGQIYWTDGAVVTMSGDTIQGQIREVMAEELTEEVNFRRNKADQNGTLYLPKDLKCFWMSGGSYFLSAQPNLPRRYKDRPRFFKRIEGGHLSLYKLSLPKTSEGFLLQKGADGKLEPLYVATSWKTVSKMEFADTLLNLNDYFPEKRTIRNNYLAVFHTLMADWSDRKAGQIAFTEQSFRKEVMAYNKALHPNTIINKSDKPLVRVATRTNYLIGVSIGLLSQPEKVYQSLGVENQHLIGLRSHLVLQGVFGYFRPQLAQNLTFEALFTFAKHQASESPVFENGSVTRNIKARHIDVQLQGVYTFPIRRNLQPYAQSGIGIFKSKVDFTSYQFNHVAPSIPAEARYRNAISPFLTGGAGLSARFSSRLKLMCGVNYQRYFAKKGTIDLRLSARYALVKKR